MSLRRAFGIGLPISLSLWLALIGAGFLTWALFATLAEKAALQREPQADRRPLLDLPSIPQRGTP